MYEQMLKEKEPLKNHRAGVSGGKDRKKVAWLRIVGKVI